jgi:hypothetical protein
MRFVDAAILAVCVCMHIYLVNGLLVNIVLVNGVEHVIPLDHCQKEREREGVRVRKRVFKTTLKHD